MYLPEQMLADLERAGVSTFAARRAFEVMDQRRRSPFVRPIRVGVLNAMPIGLGNGEALYATTARCTREHLADAVQNVSMLYLQRRADQRWFLCVLYTAAKLIPRLEVSS